MAAFVQSVSTGTTGAATTIALAFGSNVTAADLLLAFVYWNSNSQTVSSVADGRNTWSAVGSVLTGAGAMSGFRAQLFYAANAAAGATTVTVTFSGSNTDRGLAIHEASGVAQLDVSGYSNFNGTTPALSSSLAASDATARYWFAGSVVSGASTATIGGGFTLRERANFGNNHTCDEVASTASAQQCQFGLGAGTQDVMTVLAAFGAAAGGSPGFFSWF